MTVAHSILAYVPPQARGGDVPGWVIPAVIGVIILTAVMIYVRHRKSKSDD